MHRSLLVRVALAWTLLLAFASIVAAQTRGRVIKDSTIVWRPGFAVAAAVLKAGTIVEVVARRGDWYEVKLPASQGSAETTGLIAVSQLQIVEGTPAPPSRPEAEAGQPRAPARPAAEGRPVQFWGFGDVGFTAFLAHQSFDAVLNQQVGLYYGGGGEVRFRKGLFVGVTIERFSKTGERAFVSNGSVFKLGIPDKITMVPIMGTVGYRFKRRSFVPYVGGGIGTVSYQETSDFAEAGENVDDRFTSYHVLGGFEFAQSSWAAGAIEIRFTSVPGAIGVSGVSAAFGEHNLGGLDVRLKLMFGK